ncbi:MAG: T9SS type A sorting domain-containing protein, partial [Actinobacteria bacterium]|nr:T9SS type A sorting domain-containing protein [Actinomycetota bacterium]
DGGVIEASVDGGPWYQITPDGGYPYLIRLRANPGPFPQGTPVFSGSHDWAEETIQLIDTVGTVQLRFRFGSDSGGPGEGWFVDDVLILGVEPDPSDASELPVRPAGVMLYQNRPNPFSAAGGATMIRFDLPARQKVRLEVLDVSGRLVRSLADAPYTPGSHVLRWDGSDARGERVGSGVYFYVLTTGKEEIGRQILIVQ